MNPSNSFAKSEHLCGEKRITNLFTKGDAFIAYPLRVVYLFGEKVDTEPINTMVSVPKKRFKRAVKRNRIKRLMREAFRLNKHSLCEKIEEKQLQIHIAFNYVCDEEMDFATVEKKMKLAIQKLVDKADSL